MAYTGTAPAHKVTVTASAASSGASGAFTPTAGALLIAFVGARAGSSATATSLTDSLGGTWTKIGDFFGPASTAFVVLGIYARQISSSPASMTVTGSATLTGTSQSIGVEVMELVGAKASFANIQNGVGSGGAVTLTVSGGSILSCYLRQTGAAAITFPTGYTEVTGAHIAFNSMTFSYAYDLVSPGNQNWAGGANNVAVAFEIFDSAADVSATEGADTLTSTAGDRAATFSATEGTDAISSAGALALQGSLAATEGSDVLGGTAALAIAASFSATEGADAISATAGSSIFGNLAATEGGDAASTGGSLPVNASLSATEGADAASHGYTGAAPARLATASAAAASSGATAPFTPAAGNLLVAFVAARAGSSATATAITDSLGNVWTKLGDFFGPTSTAFVVLGVYTLRIGASPAAMTVTGSATLTGVTQNCGVDVIALANAQANLATLQNGFGSGGAVTLTVAGVAVLSAYLRQTATATIVTPTGYTEIGGAHVDLQAMTFSVVYDLAAPGNQNWTGGGNNVAVAFEFSDLSATLALQAALSATEGADAFASSASLTSLANLAATEGADALTFAGTHDNFATLSRTEGTDAASIQAGRLTVGDLSATEGADSLALGYVGGAPVRQVTVSAAANSSGASAAFTPPANSVLLAFVGARGGSTAVSTSITDSLGNTWEKIGDYFGPNVSPFFILGLYALRIGASPASMTVTGSAAVTGATQNVGVDVLSIGLGRVNISTLQNGFGSLGAVTLTTAGEAIISAYLRQTTAAAITIPTGYTEVGGAHVNYPSMTWSVAYDLASPGSQNWHGAANNIAIAFELVDLVQQLAIQASFAQTEGAETFSATSTITNNSNTNFIEGPDTFSAAAKVAISAAFGVTDGEDLFVITGGIGVQGYLAPVQEGADFLISFELTPIGSAFRYVIDADGNRMVDADGNLIVVQVTADADLSIEEGEDLLFSASRFASLGDVAGIDTDILAAFTQLLIGGLFSQAEGAETLAAVGGAAISGSVAVTEGSDTFASVAGQIIGAVLAQAEGPDTFVAATQLQIFGTLSFTEGTEHASLSGSALISATFGATEGADALAATGAVSNSATFSAMEGEDARALAGQLGIAGNLVGQEGPDTTLSIALIGVGATLDYTEARDTFQSIATLAIQAYFPGLISVSLALEDGSLLLLEDGSALLEEGAQYSGQDQDTLGATGYGDRSATLAATEGADVLFSSTGRVGAAAITEGADQLTVAAALAILGHGTIIELSDGLTSVGRIGIVGDVGFEEGRDTAAAVSTVADVIHADLSAAEGADTMFALVILGAEPLPSPRFVKVEAENRFVVVDAESRFVAVLREGREDRA